LLYRSKPVAMASVLCFILCVHLLCPLA
jgi:hypothetical protein